MSRRPFVWMLIVTGGALVAAGAMRSRFTPRPTSGDPVATIRLLKVRHGHLPWHYVQVDELGPRCQGGVPRACVELARAFATMQRDYEGFDLPSCVDHALYERACDGGDDQGCVELANDLWHGRCAPSDRAAARTLLRDQCLRRSHDACAAMDSLQG